MAITSFKNIINKNGYKVEEKDREIFEEGLQKSYFGQGMADEIEFVLYDSNDNQLPQGEDGKLVRYVKLDSSNISDYFIITDRNVNQRKTKASEYIVDVERLIREAGYSNGVFKTQVTLLNRRAGSEDREGDKLWIHEISPSRTEIRVLPVRGKKIIDDLEERYTALIEEKEFRDDTIYFIKEMAESVQVSDIRKSILTEKGKVSDGEKYIELIQKEFKIADFDIFLNRIRNLFLQAVDYYIDGRVSNPNNGNYGKPLASGKPPVDLPLKKINQELISILLQCIDKLLLRRNIQEEDVLTEEEQKTIDKLKQITRSSYNDDMFSSEGLPEEKAVVGCTDPKAKNYNPLAKREDGSCQYDIPPVDILGCMDKTAKNYNPAATKDDKSCKYNRDDEKLLFGQKYYIWSFKAGYEWKSENGSIQRGKGREYDEFSINHYEGTFKVVGPNADIRKYPKPRKPQVFKYKISYNSTNIPTPRPTIGTPEPRAYYNDFSGDNFFGDTRGYQTPILRTPPPRAVVSTQTSLSVSYAVNYTNELGQQKTTRSLVPGESVEVCAQAGSITLPNTNFSVKQVGQCGEKPKDILGCTDPKAINYNANATKDNGSCEYSKPEVFGCTDRFALNYNPNATKNDGSCRYQTGGGSGGGGGGGNVGRQDDYVEESNTDEINPFTNRGDFVERRKPDQNYK